MTALFDVVSSSSTPSPACLHSLCSSSRVALPSPIASLQYNSKVRLGRGFNVEELKVSRWLCLVFYTGGGCT